MRRSKSKVRAFGAPLTAAAIIVAVLATNVGTAFAHNAGFQVCKAADNANGTVTGTYQFTVNAVRDGSPVTEQFSVAVGHCSTPVTYDSGTATITETAHAGTTLVGISASPSQNLVSFNLTTRTATVTLTDSVTVITTFTNRNIPSSGCTLTWGFYKNHTSVVTSLVDGGLLVGSTTLNAAQVNALLATNQNGPNYLIKLVHQLIAAELNQLRGTSTPTAVQTAINAANALIAQQGGANGTASPSTTVTYLGVTYTASQLNNALDTYNNGLAAGGPAHCAS
jgi:hypothetical protein